MAWSKKDKQGFMMMAVGVSILAIFFVAKLVTGNKPKANADGCIGVSTAETVVVLDHSEALAEQTRKEISARVLAHVREKAEINERVTVFYVTELSKRSLIPAFSRCKPPQEGNRAVEDVKGIAKAYQRKFIEPLDAVLQAAPGNGKESPIAQALIDISLSQYLRGRQNTLLVYSDMLEHTAKFSLYGCLDRQKAVAQFRASRSGAQERPKFSQTRVVLNMIPRADVAKPTLKCRDEVWAWFFGDNEGSNAMLDVDYLPGA